MVNLCGKLKELGLNCRLIPPEVTTVSIQLSLTVVVGKPLWTLFLNGLQAVDGSARPMFGDKLIIIALNKSMLDREKSFFCIFILVCVV